LGTTLPEALEGKAVGAHPTAVRPAMVAEAVVVGLGYKTSRHVLPSQLYPGIQRKVIEVVRLD